jgi:signal transduction histidine kinase
MQSYISGFGERTAIHVTLDAPDAGVRVPPPIELTIYRILQEALTNVARHASAKHVHIALGMSESEVRLEITDDGCGFDAEAFLRNPPLGHGIGVLGMRERLATYGGQFVIQSRQGAGTAVRLSVPLDRPIDEPEESYGEDSRVVG